MEEKWKPIEGFEGLYEVSNTGKVRSLDRKEYLKDGRVRFRAGKEMAQSIKNNGYYQVILHKDGMPYYLTVHRIVAQAFIPNPNNLPQVNHIDENKNNNNADNLEWCSSLYNNCYGARLERVSQSNKNHPSHSRKILVEGVGEFPSISEFCRVFNFNESTVRCAFREDRPYKGFYIRRLT